MGSNATEPVPYYSCFLLQSFHFTVEHDVTNFVLNECRGLLPPPIEPSSADAVAPCFEVISGYLIKGIAGGLEHDVSIEQCQCYCAHSQFGLVEIILEAIRLDIV